MSELSLVAGDLAWLRGQLARYTYRPGWTLKIEPDHAMPLSMTHRIRISYRAPDSRRPDRDVPVSGTFAVPPYLVDAPSPEEEFARWLQRTLLEVERHESREWLRRDGELYDDPHATPGRS